MPSRRKLPTAQEFKETRRSIQKCLRPQNRTVRKRCAPLSTPQQRQQTLTQINYIYRVPMEEQDIDLTYLQQDALRERKRRKTTPKIVHTARIQTRSARRQALKQEEHEDLDNVVRPWPIQNPLMEDIDSTTAAAQLTCLQPPKTPRTIRKTEIPSSQSPAETPVSAETRTSVRNTSRSPLKSKSANARGRPDVRSDTIKRPRRTPKLEIQDTFDFENWDSQFSTQSHTPKTVKKAGGGRADGPMSVYSLQASKSVPPAQSSQRNNPDLYILPKSPRDVIKIKTEIQDSDDDEDDDLSVEGDTNIRDDPRATLDRAKVSPPEVDEEVVKTLQCRDVPQEQDIPRSSAQIPSSQAVLHSLQPQIKKEITTAPCSVDQAPSSQNEPMEAIPLTPPPITPTKQRSDSEQACAQLAADLNRLTQPRHPLGLETDSQFENAWRNFSPPPALGDFDLPNTTQQYPDTTHLSKNREEHVPTSQATTVDITQTTPHAPRTRTSSSQIQVLQSPVQSGRILRLPFPPLPPSSSPIGSSSAGASAWDGKVLTDSQLLPESLMNFTIPHPPSSSLAEESLEEG